MMNLQSTELRDGMTQLLQALNYVTKAENTRGPFHLKGEVTGKGLHIDVEELRQQAPTPSGNQSPRTPSPTSAFQPPADEREKKLGDFLAKPEFRAERSAVGKFLALLAFLYRENGNQFAIVQKFNGRSRKYFAHSEADLEQSGKSVNPKNIPGSLYWVVTNNSTHLKRELLRQVMKGLGYDGGFAASVVRHIDAD
jgi:negative regulator of replication initiation